MNSNTVKFYNSSGLCFALYGRSSNALKSSTNRFYDITLCHRAGCSHRWQEGGLLVVGQGTKGRSNFHQRGQKKCFQNPQKPSFTHHCITISGWEGTAAKTPAWCPFVRTGPMLWATFGLTRDRDGVANSLRCHQGLRSHPSNERLLGSYQSL